jgi:hypothetical protein
MNIYITRVADMIERVNRYIVERAITPAIARITAAHTLLVTILTALRTAGQNQSSGLGQFTGAVDTRESLRADLREFLRDVNRTGRMLNKQHLGITGIFRLPQGASAAQLLAAAEAIEAKATELETEFVACGLPASFLTEMADLIDAFRDATELKHDGRILQGGSTADLKAKASAGIAAAKDLDTCVRNHFRGNAEALGAWAIARRIERTPRRTPETTPPPATPPPSGGGGSGSTTVTAG